MSKPGQVRRAPAILKRRLQRPQSHQLAGGPSSWTPTGSSSRPLVIKVQLEDGGSSKYFLERANVHAGSIASDMPLGVTAGGLNNHAATLGAPTATTLPVDDGRYTQRGNGRTRGPQMSELCDTDGPATDRSPDDADLWDIDVKVEDGVRLKDSVSTQVDFPSRALTALTRQLIERCGKISPNLAGRAVREDLIDKLTLIVDDAVSSTKARFLLEQILAYKSKISHHSAFMAHHSKILMEISPKAYAHLKCVEGTGLISLPCKSTLRSRYPSAAYVPASVVADPQPAESQQQPQIVTAMADDEVGEHEVLLEVTDDPDASAAERLAVESEDAVETVAIHEVVGHAPTYYYVMPGGEDGVLLSNVILDQCVDQEPT